MRPLLNGGTLGGRAMRFRLSDDVLHALRQAQPDRWGDPLLREHDAFMLDPGMGPALILTTDGRVLEDGTCWDGTPVKEVTDDGALEAIVIGFRKTGVSALLELLPPRPAIASDCPRCHGDRFAPPHVEGASAEQLAQFPPFICTFCHGLGWVA
jgi:hypothetical protein